MIKFALTTTPTESGVEQLNEVYVADDKATYLLSRKYGFIVSEPRAVDIHHLVASCLSPRVRAMGVFLYKQEDSARSFAKFLSNRLMREPDDVVIVSFLLSIGESTPED